MKFYRLLTPSLIDLHFEKRFNKDDDIVFGERDEEETTPNDVTEGIRRVVEECVNLLSKNGKIKNISKITKLFFEREKKTSTAIGHHIAVPHIRTMQVNEFMLAFARSIKGIEFNHPNNDKVHLFFIMAAPVESEQIYQTVYKKLAEASQIPSFFNKLLEIEEPGELIRLTKDL